MKGKRAVSKKCNKAETKKGEDWRIVGEEEFWVYLSGCDWRS